MSLARLPFRTPEEVAAAASPAAEHVRNGGILVYPTETVYGLGCALEAGPLQRLARAKDRGADEPFLILVRDAGDAPALVWNDAARALARAFWPGPLTLALPDPDRRFPAEVRGAAGTVAVRASPHPGARAILDALGAPITSTSANRGGGEPARDGESASAVGAFVEDRVGPGTVLFLDAGPLPASEPSTILECAGGPPRVLRMGALPLARIERVIHEFER